jgi:hypothetical protein
MDTKRMQHGCQNCDTNYLIILCFSKGAVRKASNYWIGVASLKPKCLILNELLRVRLPRGCSNSAGYENLPAV